MTRHHESISATLHDGRLVQIHLTRLEGGVDVGGKLWLSLDAVPWVIEAVSKCIEDLTSSETTIGPDSLRVKEKGHELDPKVGIGNERTGPVPHARRYFLAMREAVARSLVEQLQALSE
jgi:hypothetical protein